MPLQLPPAPNSPALTDLADYYAVQSQRIQQNFEATKAGTEVLRARSDLLDALVVRLFQEFISADPQAPRYLCLLALGGYGRRELFPHSDIDLLFLTEEESAFKPPYQRLLHDAMLGVGDLFGRHDIVDAQWRIVEPVLDEVPAPIPYAQGSWGPDDANRLIGEDGPWHDPLPACSRP